MPKKLLFAFLAAGFALDGQSTTQTTAAAVKAQYEKHEFMIPMRDGVRLFTIVYTPRDTSRTYPFLFQRTPYGNPPYGADDYRPVLGPSAEFTKEGYIFVYQDVRGKFKSEGQFIHHSPIIQGSGKPNESTDLYDTIEWLLAHVPNNNGRVGQLGISYAGWEVAQGMIGAHPAIKASSPQAPPEDQFLGDDYHSGGAFELAYGFNWMASNARARSQPNETDSQRFDFGTPDGYRFFLDLGAAANAKKYFGDSVPTYDDFMRHGTYDDYWQVRNVPKDLVGIRHPVLIVAGWFDAEDFWGPFNMYRAVVEKNPGAEVHLVVGPWRHGGWTQAGDALGSIDFGSRTGDYFRRNVELPFFNAYLKDKEKPELPRALVFETGGNRWRGCGEWPPKGVSPRPLYLQAEGKASFTPPPAVARGPQFDEYVSDPRKPVPHTAEITTGEGWLWVVEDQRFVSTRPDVLVYESEPLTEDLTIAGPVPVELFVSTSGTDSDWIVKLIDVFPGDAKDPQPNPKGVRMGGYEMLLTADILRGKFRNSFSKPEPMVPGEVTRIGFNLGDRYHTFLKGHRIMVQVQSTWFPMFDRNPQTYVDIYHAKPSDYHAATERVYRSGRSASHLVLPVIAGGSGCPVVSK
jgi:putative CocE/NonD family hydrolase